MRVLYPFSVAGLGIEGQGSLCAGNGGRARVAGRRGSQELKRLSAKLRGHEVQLGSHVSLDLRSLRLLRC